MKYGLMILCILLVGCSGIEIVDKFNDKWQSRIDSALEDSECVASEVTQYPDSYYQGPLTDTHLHIPAIPDGDDANYGEGRFGGQKAMLGVNVKMSDIACTLKNEGTTKNYAFFPVYEDIPSQLLTIWDKTMEQYPDLFVPFIMSSGNDGDYDGFPTVDANTLSEMLEGYPNLFKGYGEIGLYQRERGSKALSPDSHRLNAIYPILRQNDLVVYFHLGNDHRDDFERVLVQNRDINFIFHGDQLSVSEVDELVTNHPNLYYGVDAFWGDTMELFRLFVGQSKEKYLDLMNERFDEVLDYELSKWKEVIERNPEKYIWGIDRGDAVWNYDLDVGQIQVKFARAFIGQLSLDVQEKIAYLNAKNIVGMSDNDN